MSSGHGEKDLFIYAPAELAAAYGDPDYAFQIPWTQLATITWSDAAQNNRPNKSSAVGILTCLAPVSILSGEYVPMIIVSWKSSKAPREVLGSNGSEVQAITIGEDLLYQVCCAWLEAHGYPPTRGSQAALSSQLGRLSWILKESLTR